MVVNLVTLQQKKDESLRSYIAQFNEECMEVPDLMVPTAITTLLKSTRNEFFIWSVLKNGLKTITMLSL